MLHVLLVAPEPPHPRKSILPAPLAQGKASLLFFIPVPALLKQAGSKPTPFYKTHSSKAFPITLSKPSSFALVELALFCFPPTNRECLGDGYLFATFFLESGWNYWVKRSLFCPHGEKMAQPSLSEPLGCFETLDPSWPLLDWPHGPNFGFWKAPGISPAFLSLFFPWLFSSLRSGLQSPQLSRWTCSFRSSVHRFSNFI